MSLFGPGYGECGLIHVGGGDWIVIDSCVRGGSRSPIALEYLTALGVDLRSAVKLIIATHWHDDHVRGLSQIVDACPGAIFSCSAAVLSTDFLTLTQATHVGLMMETSGVDEFREIISMLAERSSVHPRFVNEATMLLRKSGTVEVEIFALTPSDKAFIAALADIAKLLPPPYEAKKRITLAGPNHASVAVWMRIGQIHLLFGADLQEVPGGHWTRVLELPTRPEGRASYFKIPHHGASNGDHPDVWRDLIAKEAVAVLTPFRHGKNFIPGEDDIIRICSKGIAAYTTSSAGRVRPLPLNRTVEKTIAEVAIRRSVVNPAMGHVRSRRPLGDIDHGWAVEAFPPAALLCR